MTNDDTSDDKQFYDQRLLQDIEAELQSLFGHDGERAKSLLAEWHALFPSWTVDHSWHEGPFNMALLIHYSLVVDRDPRREDFGDPRRADFVQWRKQYHPIWEARLRNPELSPAQKAILRSRGVDV